MTAWPFAPMLNRPVWNAMPTPMLTITSGVAYVNVSEIGVRVLVHPLPVTRECQKPCGSTIEPVNIERYAAPTLLNVTLSAWGTPSHP